MSEKMDYREEVRELAWSYDYPISLMSRDDLTAAILALLDKVREAQAEECAKHRVIYDEYGDCTDCTECDWRWTRSKGNDVDQWIEHIAALGRK